MPLVPPHVAVATADARCGRAHRDLRYITTAFESFTANRGKQRDNLLRRLDRYQRMPGPQAERQEAAIEGLLIKMDEEDAEQADPDALDHAPRSPLAQRPAYKILAYQTAIAAAEARLQEAEAAREQAIAEAEVARVLSEGSDAGSDGGSPPPSRPAIRPLHLRMDAKLAMLMGSRGLERVVVSRSDESASNVSAAGGGSGKWFSKWGIHGVAASKYEFQGRSAGAAG